MCSCSVSAVNIVPELFMQPSLKHLNLHNTQGRIGNIRAFDPGVHVKQFHTDMDHQEVMEHTVHEISLK